MEIRMPSSRPRQGRMGKTSGIAFSLNSFLHIVRSFSYVQEVALAREMKMKKEKKQE